jgi:hypothetical protein
MICRVERRSSKCLQKLKCSKVVDSDNFATRINNPVFFALGISIVVQLVFITDYHQDQAGHIVGYFVK